MPTVETMTTKRLTLRPLRELDAADMFDYARDPEVPRFMSWLPHKDLGHTQHIVRSY